MLVDIFAMIAMAAVAYMGLAQGAYRSAQALVACVLAGAIAFGLFGPATGLLPSADSSSVWYYAGDALTLWALFCVAFLGLRTAAEKLLPVQPEFPTWPDRIVGTLLGLGTGYFVAGVCVVLTQMLPVAPDFLGYEPYKFVPAASEYDHDGIKPASRLWLNWDRGTLTFFGYLTARPLGSEPSGFLARYGDTYPPKEDRPAGYGKDKDGKPVEAASLRTVDDFLYYHWYRRWEALRWRAAGVPLAGSPLPAVGRGAGEGAGLPLETGRTLRMHDVDLRVLGVERAAAVPDFPKEPAPADSEFLMVTVRFRPASKFPRLLDSSQFILLKSLGGKIDRPPLVYGPAKAAAAGQGEIATRGTDSEMKPRNPRFGFAAGGAQGHFLADGATFDFSSGDQYDARTLVFVVPKTTGTASVRLSLEPNFRAPKDEAKPPAPPPGPPKAPAPGPPKAPPSGAAPAPAVPKLPDAKPPETKSN